MKSYKIIIADDHKLLADGIEEIINQNNLGEVIAKATDGKVLLQLLNSNKPDLVLLDINMPNLDGYDTASMVKLRHENIKIIIISQQEGKEMVQKFYDLGVDGYLSKSFERNDFIHAIIKVKTGEKVFPLLEKDLLAERKQNTNFKNGENTFNLSEREKEIIKLISSGLTTNQIALKLFLSEYTVETHRKNIGKKTGANSPCLITNFAIEHNLK
jgi:DNA-binding NarL/FixJ family response regulator